MNLIQSIFGANLGGPQPMFMGQQPMGLIPQQFRRKYHAYSPIYWRSENRDKLESGDKIVMPASALEELSRMQIQFPIMFEIAHDSEILPKKSHCSVMEFTAPEGSCYLPLWMIDNLGLDPQGDSVIELSTVSLAKGVFVQFQAHETKFAMLSNPRVVLEKNLRGYSCLTVGDTIQVEFNNHIYKLDVTEVKPSIQRGTAPPAISIIETDIKVDFKEPRDYAEWEKKNKMKRFNTEEKTNDTAADEEEDDFGVILDPIKNAKNTKCEYFQSLEQTGSHAQKLKKQKSSPANNKNNNNTNTQTTNNLNSLPINPYSTRGSPLGKKRAASKTTGKCKYKKPKYVNGNMAMGNLLKQKSVRKEEEIVGSMRYIYEIDDNGNRQLVRRLPVRKVSGASKEQSYSLKNSPAKQK